MLTPEEIAVLKKSSDPATAALGEKLEKEQENNIPKSRFDEVNEKRKTAEEALAKKLEEEKKAAEAKALEDGKVKELLSTRDAELVKANQEKAELQKKADELEKIKQEKEASEKKMRDAALAKIKDAELKAIADKLTNVEDVVAFVDKLESGKIPAYVRKGQSAGSGNGQGKTRDDFKNLHEYETYLRAQGKL